LIQGAFDRGGKKQGASDRGGQLTGGIWPCTTVSNGKLNSTIPYHIWSFIFDHPSHHNRLSIRIFTSSGSRSQNNSREIKDYPTPRRLKHCSHNGWIRFHFVLPIHLRQRLMTLSDSTLTYVKMWWSYVFC